jgi:hypothetical protein
VVLPRRLGGPSLAILPLILFVLFSGRNDNHEVTATKLPYETLQNFWLDGKAVEDCLNSENQLALKQLDTQLLAWLRARAPSNKASTPVEVPLVVLSGSGGGVRAAEFFARTMVELDDLTAGRFGDYVSAASTVSGASLGAAVWIKARRAAYDEPPIREDLRFWPTFQLINEFFARDYLSPVVGALLTRDALQQVLPFALPGGDRAQVMEAAWEQGWTKAVDAVRPHAAADFRQFGQVSTLAMAGTAEHAAPPLVVFNSTEVHTGRRFLVANTKLAFDSFPDAYIAIGSCSLHGIVDMPLATAAHLSARFTFVSPAATIKGVLDRPTWEAGSKQRPLTASTEPPVPWGQVVDGGYFENYGATTAKELAQSIVASFARLKSQGLVPTSLNLRVIGLSLVNDPLDLGNVPLHQVHRVESEWPDPNHSEQFAKIQLSERRFEAVWPIANTYDLRELLGLLGVVTPLGALTNGSRVDNEVVAPLSAVLKTRESRGQTAEREFMEYLESLNAGDRAGVRGSGLDVRLGRMLRDSNLLAFANGGAFGSAIYPTFGSGSYGMPNPGLAWVLSSKSRQGMMEAIRMEYAHKSRYQSDTDMQRVVQVFEASCASNAKCRIE